MFVTIAPAMRQLCGRTNGYEPPVDGHLRLRRQQSERENHFLRRHAAVEERAAITALVLAQLGRIDEEAVVRREQRVAAGAASRKTQIVLVRERQRLLRTLGSQVLAELVAEICGRIALGEHCRRRVAVDRAVIGREQHRDLSARRFLQNAEQRRALEPLPRDLPQRDLVARDFVQDLRFAASVREQVDEVEDECAHAFAADRGAEVALELVGVLRGGDLLIANRRRAVQLVEMRLEQLALVRVERFVFAIGVAPPVGESRRDLAGKQSAEERVARVRRRRRKHREVMRRLDVEERREQRLEHAPLVEPQTIDDDEHRRAVALENRQQELADDVDRERRPVSLEILEPRRILRPSCNAGELAVHVGIESAAAIVESHLAGGGEVDVPSHQLVEAVDPAAPVEIPVALELDRAESLDEPARDRLLADARTLENLRHDAQHLPRIDRLDEVVADVRRRWPP